MTIRRTSRESSHSLLGNIEMNECSCNRSIIGNRQDSSENFYSKWTHGTRNGSVRRTPPVALPGNVIWDFHKLFLFKVSYYRKTMEKISTLKFLLYMGS